MTMNRAELVMRQEQAYSAMQKAQAIVERLDERRWAGESRRDPL